MLSKKDNLENLPHPLRRIRSFAKRDGRMTVSQREAIANLWSDFGLSLSESKCDFSQVFHREAKTILEIGFGSGQSLLAVAKAYPECNFIGIETYQPGVGSLLLGIQAAGLQNIRVFYADAVEVLDQCILPASLDGIQIFFPDPWPKRNHHKRRLIQAPFVNILTEKIKSGGILHLATDWEHYAEQMMRVLSENANLHNTAGNYQYATRSTQRPIITKFEGRGQQANRPIRELQFQRIDTHYTSRYDIVL